MIVGFTYVINNEKLRTMLDKKAMEFHMSIDELGWGYINRGLADDSFNDEILNKLHSEKYLKQINDALGLN